MKKKIIFANRKTTIDGRQYPPKTTTEEVERYISPIFTGLQSKRNY